MIGTNGGMVCEKRKTRVSTAYVDLCKNRYFKESQPDCLCPSQKQQKDRQKTRKEGRED